MKRSPSANPLEQFYNFILNTLKKNCIALKKGNKNIHKIILLIYTLFYIIIYVALGKLLIRIIYEL